MTKSEVAIKAEVRAGASNQLRSEGAVPGVLYGHGADNQSIQVDSKELSKVLTQAGRTTLVKLSVGKEDYQVLIKDVQHHPLSEAIVHADFYQVNLKKKVKANIPLAYVGESVAVKDLGGVLVRNRDEIEVEALPVDLPHGLEVDISVMDDFEKVLKVSDISLPEGVEALADPEMVVALVQAPRTAEELESLDEEIKEDVEATEGVADETEDEEGEEGEEKPADSEEKPTEEEA